MSDVDALFNEKVKTIVRPAILSKNEHVDLIKPYMGNPFYAPGTPGARYQAQSKGRGRKQYESDDLSDTDASSAINLS